MKVAITGGIGSGKSYVCRALEKHGIRVYDCDAAAKRLMRSDAQLQADLMRLVGDEVYVDGVLNAPRQIPAVAGSRKIKYHGCPLILCYSDVRLPGKLELVGARPLHLATQDCSVT